MTSSCGQASLVLQANWLLVLERVQKLSLPMLYGSVLALLVLSLYGWLKQQVLCGICTLDMHLCAQANWLLVLERVLKLSMPTLYGWVLIFYLLFHGWLKQQVLCGICTLDMHLCAQANWLLVLERVLKLSMPTLYGWVLIFYLLFHVWLNLLAELTLFGDREFYKVGPTHAVPLTVVYLLSLQTGYHLPLFATCACLSGLCTPGEETRA